MRELDPDVLQTLSQNGIGSLPQYDMKAVKAKLGIQSSDIELTVEERILLSLGSILMTDDESHGLGLTSLPLGYASVGLRVMLSSPDLGSALASLSRYFSKSYSIFKLTLSERDGDARVILQASGRSVQHTADLEAIWISAISNFVSWYLGAELRLSDVSVHPHASIPNYLADRNPNAKTNGSGVTMLEFPSSLLKSRGRLRHSSEPLHEAMIHWLNVKPTGQTPVKKTMHALGTQQSLGGYEDDYINKDLSNRQKRRVFKNAYGRTFRAETNDQKAQIALSMLRSSDQPLIDIAEALGYSDDRSLRRFLRTQTGLSPTQIRQGVLQQPESISTSSFIEGLRHFTKRLDV